MTQSILQSVEKFVNSELPKDKNLRLLAWHELAMLQKQLKAVELELRREMADSFFDDKKLTEGTNTAEIGEGWKLKYKHAITRACDEASFDAVFAKLPENYQSLLIRYKPELILPAYRKLSASERRIMDRALIIKPSSPALELVEPKVKIKK